MTASVTQERPALTRPLPRQSTVEVDLLDQAVDAINSTYIGKGLEMARDIGEYVLATFFDGDLDSRRNLNHEGPARWTPGSTPRQAPLI